jgi:hypothetical protein
MEKDYNSSGIFLPLLTTLFIGLKLTGYIDWSWWWVLSPLWIPFAIVLVCMAIIFSIYVVVYVVEKYLA